MRLIMIRHGDPRRDSFLLTDKGVAQARLLGKYFRERNVDKIISADSIRARETVKFFTETFGEHIRVEYADWLGEFKHNITLPDGTVQFAWEMPIDFWCNDGGMLEYSRSLDNPIYASIKTRVENVWNRMDELLADFGCVRAGHFYRAEKSNCAACLVFSHFATISVMLSHLLNVPLAVMLHAFWQAPSAFTTVRTEEVERGKVLFRCIGFGQLDHLLGHEELRSFYGLQRETFEGAKGVE